MATRAILQQWPARNRRIDSFLIPSSLACTREFHSLQRGLIRTLANFRFFFSYFVLRVDCEARVRCGESESEEKKKKKFLREENCSSPSRYLAREQPPFSLPEGLASRILDDSRGDTARADLSCFFSLFFLFFWSTFFPSALT